MQIRDPGWKKFGSRMGKCAGVLAPTGCVRELLASIGCVQGLWAPTGCVRGLWAPIGCVYGLRDPIGCVQLWVLSRKKTLMA